MGSYSSKFDIEWELSLLYDMCKSFVLESPFHKNDSDEIIETYTYSLMLEFLGQLEWRNSSIQAYKKTIQSLIDNNMKGLVTKEDRKRRNNSIKKFYKKVEEFLSKELNRSKLKEFKRKRDEWIKEKKNKENKHFQNLEKSKSIFSGGLSQTGLNFNVF